MKKLIFFITVIVLLIIIGNLALSIVSLWSKKDLLTNTEKQLAREEKDHQQLLNQWKKVRDPSFIEEQARDKLFLAKSGDVEVFLIPATPSGMQKKQRMDNRPIWLTWWDFFFMQ